VSAIGDSASRNLGITRLVCRCSNNNNYDTDNIEKYLS
jgi:hypothetical protein